MLSLTVPIGGALAVVAVVLLALSATNRRARIGLMVLALSGVAVAECGYLRIARVDGSDREALLKERKHLCGSVAFHILGTQGQYLGGAYRPPLVEQRAAFSALGNEVLVTWGMCVREESECGSMLPGLPIDPTEDVLGAVRRCFEGGPRPLESARLFLKD